MDVFRNTALPLEARVQDLMARMTLDEKIAQLGSFWVYQLLDGTQFSEVKAAALMGQGIGQVTRVGGASNVTPRQSADLNNQIQNYAIERTRLGIPVVIHEECCSGYMARGATVFPQAIGAASTWEPRLVQAMTDVIRQQMRSVGAHHALAPVLDIARDARWGRVEETFGEDPYLVAQMGMAYVRGIQGGSFADGIVATGKHFVGYGMSEGGLNWAPPHLAPRELRETHLLPFEAAVRAAGLGSIMNGYHELDGIPCGANRWLLTDVLRGEWGFSGTVVSDYFAVAQLQDYHHVAANRTEAAHQALAAGLDVELPATDGYGAPLKAGVESGSIPMDLIDTALERVLRQKFELGLFENPYVDAGLVAFDTPPQRALAREIARQSIVLLRNEGGLLPLSPAIKSIAVVGPNADTTRHLFGDYSYPAHMETLAEMFIKNAFGQALPGEVDLTSDFIEAASVLQALNDAGGPDVTIRYAQGCSVRGDSREGFAEAVARAKAADVAILVVGDKAGLTDDCTSGEARDRAILDLPGVQADLVRAVYETGTPVVLVLVNGRPVTLGWMAEEIPAIVEAWFPAEEGAQAIADVLFGVVNPGGKLPISFPRAVGQIPVFYSHRPSGGRSNWKTDYVETPVKPLYPFGFGLSYTTFELGGLSISPAEARAGTTVEVALMIVNTGSLEGDEVVQLYTHQYVPAIMRPVKGAQRLPARSSGGGRAQNGDLPSAGEPAGVPQSGGETGRFAG
ncbi:MAG TPA: glycoside hydrolase family 3 N-terminal domain-containing protein [Candidatus Limnocylindrales bacterium]|nr:glycoside hydrolase family 3 N-terminal domain-containing protein [Candidatus Limnocylindrales bacterium]